MYMMRDTTIGPVLYLLALLAGVFAAPTPVLAAKLYDVSYVWSRDATAVQQYRERVARILGSQAARRLRVVSSNEMFGLIYLRRGDSAGATRVARSHSKLLQARGLDAASPTFSREWRFVDGDAARTASSAPAKLATASKPPGKTVVKSKSAKKAKPAKQTTSVQKRRPASKVEHRPTADNLEAAVEGYIKRLRREGKIAADERTAWSVYDFTTGKKLVTINEDMQFQAASLIKPFIATAFFHQVKRGKLSYGPKSRRHMERMIQRSSNNSTNWIMRRVGGPKAVQRILKGHYGGIFQETRIVEYIPTGGRTYRNKASVHDYSRFLFALWKKKIPRAGELKRLMALPGSDRIYTGAREIPRGVKVYNKTGSTARLCGDMGILSVKGKDGKRYPYTVIGVIEKRRRANNYSDWIRSRGDVIRQVSGIIYQDIAKRHGLL